MPSHDVDNQRRCLLSNRYPTAARNPATSNAPPPVSCPVHRYRLQLRARCCLIVDCRSITHTSTLCKPQMMRVRFIAACHTQQPPSPQGCLRTTVSAQYCVKVGRCSGTCAKFAAERCTMHVAPTTKYLLRSCRYCSSMPA